MFAKKKNIKNARLKYECEETVRQNDDDDN